MSETESYRVSSDPAAPIDRRERWRLLVEEQRQSGMSISAFCKERSIPPSAFFAWRRKLGITGRVRSNRQRDDKAGFAEVKGVGRSKPLTPPLDAGIELQLPGGRWLVVRGGFDRDLLIELVRVLEDLPSMLKGLA
jgi:hypothetical protein